MLVRSDLDVTWSNGFTGRVGFGTSGRERLLLVGASRVRAPPLTSVRPLKLALFDSPRPLRRSRMAGAATPQHKVATGLWIDPNESGGGPEPVSIQGATVWASLFVYGPDGQPGGTRPPT
jgi:hypothetical protein